ncbi:probable LRR receptor-like serine/threonine-protein kinase At2g16250 [Lotus japonicus]|uniref:probable LRR receptor-like serine/threonine-protein kinase At2g16250 n=1 Tax=Lotus japonicus TaxID=34305 RepID=UPI002587251D|nr:probable LRR receptor-like serine/threonine-protein kinase At2g16250 [Lotus japonicus]
MSMGVKRGVAVSSVMVLFLLIELTSTTSLSLSLSSRTEWFSLLELRSSLGIRGKDWPIKAEPCRNWTGVQCRHGRVVGIHVAGLRRTRSGRLNPSFEVDALKNFTLLESFNASGFMLNGSIPEWFGENLSVLQVLDLRSCSITGVIPGSLSNLRMLKSLLLSGNSLTGRMPSNLGFLSGLSVLDLSGNILSGIVPSSFSKLSNITRLDLGSNYLSGSVPPELGSLSNLKFLNLSDNAFTGSVLPQLSNLFKLVKLDLSMNFLSGSLPGNLFSSAHSALQLVDVSNNNLTGLLPEWSSSKFSSTGARFNLSNNLFYGSLNTSLNKFKMIDLSGNYLEGEVQGGLSNNVTLARNCLQMIPNQRGLEECRVFYVKRNLLFDAGGEDLMKSKSRSNKRMIFILAGVFGGLGFIVLLVLVLMLVLKQCYKSKSLEIQRGTAKGGPVPEGESPTPPKGSVFVTSVGDSFTFEQMLNLTGNFAEANLFKHGHSGDLFWGVLESGATVVVKKVDLNLFKRESYFAELGLLSKVSHARLVPILGHCLENEKVKCIIYKYMPNGDLATSLHSVPSSDGKLKSLDWITRLKIAIGAAEGLAYLHECSPPLVHRDVQASSILLDDKYEVRLGSLSEITAQEDLHQSVISRVFSKPRSPIECNSDKSSVTCAYDVYCFGKVLLELVTGNLDISKSDDAATKECLDQTLSYITIFDKERLSKIVDPSLIVDEDLLEEVWAMAIVAKSCLNPKPSKRPPMKHVLKALENPLKIVREENFSSAKLRTTSSNRSWSTAFFGSWRHSSSESASATAHGNREGGTSGIKQAGRVGSQGSGGNDHSSSNKRSSNEIFPEPLEMQDVETGEAR